MRSAGQPLLGLAETEATANSQHAGRTGRPEALRFNTYTSAVEGPVSIPHTTSGAHVSEDEVAAKDNQERQKDGPSNDIAGLGNR